MYGLVEEAPGGRGREKPRGTPPPGLVLAVGAVGGLLGAVWDGGVLAVLRLLLSPLPWMRKLPAGERESAAVGRGVDHRTERS
ncbi:hypothetical protein EDD98_1259 [Streptomyces sp. PanSC19]|uniref:hypothetical protein n=1 Tax=Streptomyces sp. PanSC19 TaxID=1520455 RepID=UPI000F93794E|nr:hypothetical protein [Streptomyces sp. PanSC19]ROQ32282.1 hypothetical protein EDD98_1259 [Streptomyces sp. PanSC19]